MRHEQDEDGDCVPDCPRCAEQREHRHSEFLRELQDLSAKHGLHINAWAQYADSAFFGIEEGAAFYEFEREVYSDPGAVTVRAMSEQERAAYLKGNVVDEHPDDVAKGAT